MSTKPTSTPVWLRTVHPGQTRVVTPPPLPGTPISLGRLVAAPVACLVLAMVSVAAGAFVLPRLGSREASPRDSLSITEPSATETPREETPPVITLEPLAKPDSTVKEPPRSSFDVPAIPPRLPFQTGPYAISLRIDNDINARLSQARIPASPIAGDAEFLRRVHLDLIGKIPTRERAAAFLADTDPLKRTNLIDELLARPEFGQHFARLWADTLVKRDFDNNKGLNPAAFTRWLAEQFNKDMGWDTIVRDMVTASGVEQKTPQTFFILAHQDNRQVSPSKLVGAVGNLFMGIQIQCAECHKHPFHDKWVQNDFWGMAAFFGHTRAQRETGPKGKKQVGPATIVEIEQQAPAKGKKGKIIGKPIKPGLVIAIPDPNDPRKVIRTTRGKFFESNRSLPSGKAPYRPAFADWLTSSANPYFAPAAVNRLWAHFFARGLVHPIEEMSDKNPATHPELLRSLAASLGQSKFHTKDMIRALCNSQAYQRTSRPVSTNAEDDKLYSHMPVKVLDAKQLVDSLAVATKRTIRPGTMPAGKRGQRDAGDPMLRYLDTREYDDDATEFTYGIPQLLRLMNSSLTTSSAQRIRELAGEGKAEPARVLDEIYLTALARRPTVDEQYRMLAYITKQSDPHKGYAGVFWALLNCAEFISNR